MIGPAPTSEGLYPIRARARIDRALSILRTLPARELLGAVWPGALSVLVLAALYVVERVEGVRSLRPLFGALLAAAYVLRCVRLARWSGRRVEALLAEHGLPATHAPTQAIVRASFWVGADLWLWLWLAVLVIRIEPWLLVGALPCFGLRAAWAPSFLASADGASQHSGLGVARAAAAEGDGHRLAGMAGELLLLCGALGLAFNLGAVSIGIVGLGQDVLGLDLSFVRAFLSPRNYFALLLLAGVSLVAVEPVRATTSALMYVDTRLTRDGLALRSLVARCVSEGRRGRLLALLLALSVAASGTAHAQDAGAETSSSELTVQLCDPTCERARASDGEVKRRVTRILQGQVFAEFPDPRWDTRHGRLSALFEEIADWLASLSRDEQVTREPHSSLRLPGPVFFLLLAAVIALSAWLVLRRRATPASEATRGPDRPEDPYARSPDEYFRQAQRQRSSDLTVALRSLYLATLVGLARRGRLTLAPERTNGQYLEELGGTPERAPFAALTRSFDLVQYGQQAPSQDDFDRCLSLAERLVGRGAPP